MSRLTQLPVLACTLLVLLRISIGWQFLYEGLWKFNSLNTARPWTAEGYLKNAQGPFRSYFRGMTGDPDDLDWLDQRAVETKWNVWHKQFVNHYQLDKDQRRRLSDSLNGPKAYYARLGQLPEGVEFGGSLGKVIKFEEKQRRLAVPNNWRMLPRERDILLRKVTIEADPSEEDKARNELAKAYQKAIREVFARSARLSFKARLGASLAGDPERAGLILKQHKNTIDYKRLGEIELYKEYLNRHERNLAKAQQDFQYEHLKKQWSDLQQLRSRLVGPVKALDSELKTAANKLLTEAQIKRGPVSLPPTPVDQINTQTRWALTVIGILLIVGLFSRLSAVAGAGLLLMFYLAIPPWPGVPAAPGPEHSFIVNKNLIEVIALLALATLPSGRWLGLDALFRRFVLCQTTD